MGIEERDPHTGYLTTGHEWNGITELNTPVPRVIYFFLIVTAIYSLIYWILMPAWPIGVTYTKGLLGFNDRQIVSASVDKALLDFRTQNARIEHDSFADIQKDAGLMKVVRETGRTLFGDNCAACHGRDAQGGKGYPALITHSWLWGGTPETIAETIRVGINAAHPETRTAQMPAFGRDAMLSRSEIDNAVAFVRSLSHPGDKRLPADKVAAGHEVFAANCAACHGDDAKGNSEMGAPDLTDASWIYGGDAQSLTDTIWNGRQGHMPSWETRLSELDRKILTLYLVDLRNNTP